MGTSMLMNLFPGVTSLLVQDPMVAGARILLIIFGFFFGVSGF